MVREQSNTRVVIDGAGTSEANGIYVADCMKDGVQRFARKSTWNGRKATFKLYRRRDSTDGIMQWRITVRPAAGGNIVLYYTPSEDDLPPWTKWKIKDGSVPRPVPIVVTISPTDP